MGFLLFLSISFLLFVFIGIFNLFLTKPTSEHVVSNCAILISLGKFNVIVTRSPSLDLNLERCRETLTRLRIAGPQPIQRSSPLSAAKYSAFSGGYLVDILVSPLLGRRLNRAPEEPDSVSDGDSF